MIEKIHQWQDSIVEDGVFIRASAVSDYTNELTDIEYSVIDSSVAIRKNTYSTGRLCAKAALADIGIDRHQYTDGLLRQPDGSVAWPTGAVGSISHTNDWAVAVATKSGGPLLSLGIDIERIDRVKKDVLRLIATEQERTELESLVELRWGRVALFSIKESLYKCLRPIYGDFIQFKDVQIANLTVASENTVLEELRDNDIEVYCPTVQLLLPALAKCCDEQRIRIRLAILPSHVLSYVSYQSPPQ